MLIQYSWNDERLRDIWNKLYTDNPYLFPFSSWEYTKEVCSYKKIKPTTLLQKEYIFVYYNHDVPLMIMPLFIKKKKLYIFGENISGPDNLDFIYDKNIRDEDIFLALKELKEKFHGIKLSLYKINEKSRLYQFLVLSIFFRKIMNRILVAISQGWSRHHIHIDASCPYIFCAPLGTHDMT